MSETSNEESRPAPFTGLWGVAGIIGLALLLGAAMVLMALATANPNSRPPVVFVTATDGPAVAAVASAQASAIVVPTRRSAPSASAAPTELAPVTTTDPGPVTTTDPGPVATTASGAPAADTATPPPAATVTATPTPFPMSIAAMRLGSYPGSDLVIEKELASGVNYHRYYASYQSEGLKIYALLTIPFGQMPAAGWPVIVFNHGYIPPEVYRSTERYVNYVDRLAQAGYIVLRSDYRGHGQSEGEARGAYSDPDYVVDVLNAVASVKRLPEADPDHIGMWGHSMGGYITLRAMVIDPDIKVGVIWGGVVAPYPDLFARGNIALTPTPQPNGTAEPDLRGWRAWLDEYGTREENPAFWDALSANAYLTDLAGPLQLHHGTADKDVPLAASEALYAEMQAAGMPVEFYTYENDNHNLSVYFTLAMNRTIAFFDAVLKP